MKRVRLLSIDVDALQEHEQKIGQFHIGLSILDTQCLQTMLRRPLESIRATDMIESYHFVVGAPTHLPRESRKFLFGKHKVVSLDELKVKLHRMTCHRNVVLVFHGGDRELSVLNRLNLELSPLYTIDTVKAAQHPLKLSYRMSLEKLLEEFKIPFTNLHVAGNDSHFVLRALLMIAVRDAKRQLNVTPDWVPLFEAVAQSPRPISRFEKRSAAFQGGQQKDEAEPQMSITLADDAK